MFYLGDHNIRPQLYIVFSQSQMIKDFVRLEYGSHVILVLIVQFLYMSCHIFRHARLFPREGGGGGDLRDYWLKMENNVTFSWGGGGGGSFV